MGRARGDAYASRVTIRKRYVEGSETNLGDNGEGGRRIPRRYETTRGQGEGQNEDWVRHVVRKCVVLGPARLPTFTALWPLFLLYKTSMAPQQNQLQVPNFRLRILIIGRANAGKTTILKRVCDTTQSPKVYRLDESGQRFQVCPRS